MHPSWKKLAQWVTTFEQDSTHLLWNRLTGRSIQLSGETLQSPIGAGIKARLQREWMWSEGPHMDWEQLIPCRSKLILYLPNECVLWVPVPHHHTAGGYGYRAIQLSPTGAAIWEAINDSRSIQQVAKTCEATLLQVQTFCSELCSPEHQVLQLRASPPRPNDPSLHRLVGLPRPNHERTEDVYGTHGETDLLHYHLHQITDGRTHFDDRETTVAHAFGVPHAALGGLSFGAKVQARLDTFRSHQPKDIIVEVGCGTGEMAYGWLKHSTTADTSTYIRVDLSPELLSTQAKRAPQTLGIHGNAMALPLQDNSVNVLLSNEVIADLPSVPVAPDTPTEASENVFKDLERYHLPIPQESTIYNQGSWRFLEEIARVLAPGGLAFVSEFGSPDQVPEEAVQLDHPEVSIQFGVLKHVATQLNLSAELIRMDEFLEMDMTALHPTRNSWMALRALAKSQQRHLSARSWTPEEVRAQHLFPFDIQGIQWCPLFYEGPGPLITRFWVLILRKSA